MYYAVSQDCQVQEYAQLRKKILAEEAERKQKQRQLRLDLGLPDLDDNRGILTRILKKKCQAGR